MKKAVSQITGKNDFLINNAKITRLHFGKQNKMNPSRTTHQDNFQTD